MPNSREVVTSIVAIGGTTCIGAGMGSAMGPIGTVVGGFAGFAVGTRSVFFENLPDV